MEYSQIILEMLERIKVLENKVRALEDKQDAIPTEHKTQTHDLSGVSAKYRGLTEYLLKSGEDSITLTYAQIERILGFPLPSTAKNYKQAYWANTTTHSYSSSWMGIGYKARVNLDSDQVTFIRNTLEVR